MAEFKVPPRINVDGIGIIDVPPTIKSQPELKAYIQVRIAQAKSPNSPVGAPVMSPIQDVANMAGSELGRAVASLPGLPVDIARAGVGARDWAVNRGYLKAPEQPTIGDVIARQPLGSPEFIKTFEESTGANLNYKPQTSWGEYLQPPISTAANVLVTRSPRGAVMNPSRVAKEVAAGFAGGGVQSALENSMDFSKSGNIVPVAGNIATQILLGRAGRTTPASAIERTTQAYDDVRNTESSLWKNVDNAGIYVDPTAYKAEFAGLDPHYFDSKNFPTTANYLARLNQRKFNQYSFDNLNRVRQDIQADLAKPGSIPGSELNAMKQVRDKIDSLLENASYTGGNASVTSKELSGMIQGAREVSATRMKADKLIEAVESGAYYSGGPEIGIRQKFATLLKNPSTRKKFSQDEIDFMTKVSRSDEMANAIAEAVGDTAKSAALSASFSQMPVVAAFMNGIGNMSKIATKKALSPATERNAQTAINAVLAGKAGQEEAKRLVQQDILARSRGNLRGLYSAIESGGLLDERLR